MIEKANWYLAQIKTTTDKSKKKQLLADFQSFYTGLSDCERTEIEPFWNRLKTTINQQFEKIDLLSEKAELMLQQMQLHESVAVAA